MRLFLYSYFACVLLMSSVGVATADGQSVSEQDLKQAEVSNTPDSIAQRKAVLMKFVEENHADLKRLLNLLENRKPAQYRKAMKALSRQFERLQNVKKRDPEKYQIALRLWKVHSRIEVVSAQIQLKGPEGHRGRLVALLRQKQEIKIQLQKHDIARQQDRLKRMRESLKRTRESIDSDVEKQLNQIINSSRTGKRRSGASGTPSSNQSDQSDQSGTTRSSKVGNSDQ